MLGNADADNLHVHLRLLLVGLDIFDLVHHVESLHGTSKDSMLVVEPGSLLRGYEELTAVGVGARVGHGQSVGFIVSQTRKLIGELASPDRLATGTVALRITALNHEFAG
jgi:hypothetical protein